MSAVTPRGQAGDACPKHGPGHRLLDRWELLSLITGLRREIGLTDRDVMVLRAHLTVLPQGPLDPRKLNVSFMGVAEILDRACGMEARRFRRGEARLEEVGLVRRHLSANGRRFPERDREGRIVNAYGIDLAPIFDKHAELLLLRDRLDEERVALRSRKNSLSARLQDVLRRLTVLGRSLPDWAEELRLHVRNVLRRKTTAQADLDALEEQVDRIAQEAETSSTETRVEQPAPCPAATSETAVSPDSSAADAGQIVRHIESKHKDLKKEAQNHFDLRRAATAWAQTKNLQEFYPDVPQRERELAGVLIQFSSFIGLGQRGVNRGLETLGWEAMILVLDYLSARTTQITRPEGYLASMLKSYEAGQPIAGGRVIPPVVQAYSDASVRRTYDHAPCPVS